MWLTNLAIGKIWLHSYEMSVAQPSRVRALMVEHANQDEVDYPYWWYLVQSWKGAMRVSKEEVAHGSQGKVARDRTPGLRWSLNKF